MGEEGLRCVVKAKALEEEKRGNNDEVGQT